MAKQNTIPEEIKVLTKEEKINKASFLSKEIEGIKKECLQIQESFNNIDEQKRSLFLRKQILDKMFTEKLAELTKVHE